MEPWLLAAPHRSPSLSVIPSPHHLSSFGTAPQRRRLKVAAAMKRAIPGVSEELNSIASLNLDQAPTRRLVRAAFAEVHRSLDHILFKVIPPGIIIEESYERNSKGCRSFAINGYQEQKYPSKARFVFAMGMATPALSSLKVLPKELLLLGMEYMPWIIRDLDSQKGCTATLGAAMN